jgi:predicted dehydrogenase
MSDVLRVGVIGAGVFGGYHAAKWAAFEGVRLTAILDPHPDRARAVAEPHGAAAIGEAAPFLEAVDIISIASPADSHADWALAALKAGKPVYVEKPLATDMADAAAIVGAARRGGLVAACGFLERAALEAIGLLKAPERPLRMEAVRRGPPSPRCLDVSVILDLMIHDLDLALALAPGEPFAVEAQGACVVNDLTDQAEAEVMFEHGFTARFVASRVAEAPERRLSLVYPSGTIDIDLAAGTLSGAVGFAIDPRFGERPEARDRLGASLAAFLAAVRGAGKPLADAGDGSRALDLALAVQQALGE